MSVEERAKLAIEIENRKNSEPEDVSVTIGLWIVLGLFLALIAYVALSFLQRMLNLGIEAPELLFDFVFYAVVLAITLFVVWGVVTGVQDVLRGRNARARIIGNINTDLKMGAVAEQSYRITDYFTLFDKRGAGLAYVMRTRSGQVVFCNDKHTYWIPGDKAESGPPEGWDPRPGASWPRRRLCITQAPRSGILLDVAWKGRSLPPASGMTEVPSSSWPVNEDHYYIYYTFFDDVVEVLCEDWDALRARYFGISGLPSRQMTPVQQVRIKKLQSRGYRIKKVKEGNATRYFATPSATFGRRAAQLKDYVAVT